MNVAFADESSARISSAPVQSLEMIGVTG